MKTVIIYNTVIDPLKFIVAEGDLSRFDGMMINACGNDEKLQDELVDLLYDPVTGQNTDLLNSAVSTFPVQAVRDGAIVIVAGFLP
jgi:hypothetical protein